MDNVTHTMIGLIAGESFAQSPPSARGLRPGLRRDLFVLIAVIGNNLPDIDLVYSYRGPASGDLTYMLQHRGYTHTVIGCAVLTLLLYGSVAAWLRRRRIQTSRADHFSLLAVASISTALHLFMDGLNSYGIHPFWPFQNRWMYGDSVFIVEPLYWAAAAPLIFVLKSRISRVLLSLTVLAAVLLSVASGLVPPIACGGLIVLVLGLLAIGRLGSARTAALAGAFTFAVVTGGFVLAGHIAAQRIEALARTDFPADSILDTVLTPMPADPLCWDALLLQTRGDSYIARHAVLALSPALIPATRCASPTIDRTTFVPQSPAAVHDSITIRWREFTLPGATLIALARGYCAAAGLLQFARAPFAVRHADGWIMGDLRFDRGPAPGFSDITVAGRLTAAQPCPRAAPWTPPREDLLND